jgi:hypothetical protein
MCKRKTTAASLRARDRLRRITNEHGTGNHRPVALCSRHAEIGKCTKCSLCSRLRLAGRVIASITRRLSSVAKERSECFDAGGQSLSRTSDGGSGCRVSSFFADTRGQSDADERRRTGKRLRQRRPSAAPLEDTFTGDPRSPANAWSYESRIRIRCSPGTRCGAKSHSGWRGRTRWRRS